MHFVFDSQVLVLVLVLATHSLFLTVKSWSWSLHLVLDSQVLVLVLVLDSQLLALVLVLELLSPSSGPCDTSPCQHHCLCLRNVVAVSIMFSGCLCVFESVCKSVHPKQLVKTIS